MPDLCLSAGNSNVQYASATRLPIERHSPNHRSLRPTKDINHRDTVTVRTATLACAPTACESVESNQLQWAAYPLHNACNAITLQVHPKSYAKKYRKTHSNKGKIYLRGPTNLKSCLSTWPSFQYRNGYIQLHTV